MIKNMIKKIERMFFKKNSDAKLPVVAKILIRVFHYGVQNESFTMKGITTWK
jgi:hypothetical protein